MYLNASQGRLNAGRMKLLNNRLRQFVAEGIESGANLPGHCRIVGGSRSVGPLSSQTRGNFAVLPFLCRRGSNRNIETKIPARCPWNAIVDANCQHSLVG